MRAMWLVILTVGLAVLAETSGLQFLLSEERNVRTSASYGRAGLRPPRSAVHLVDTTNDSVSRLWETDRLYSMDHHHSRGEVYYSNYSHIIRRNINCSEEQCAHVVAEASVVYGLAVDWVHERLYWSWTDGQQSALESAGLEGQNSTAVISSEELRRLLGSEKTPLLYQVNLDPYESLLFVLATNSTHDFFIRSNLKDGQLTIISPDRDQMEISTFGINYGEQRLYFTDEQDDSLVVYSCDYDGGGLERMETGARRNWISAMQVFLGNMFVVRPTTAEAQLGPMARSNDLFAVSLKRSKRTSLKRVMHIKDLSTIKQMRVYDSRSQLGEEAFRQSRCRLQKHGSSGCPEKTVGSWRTSGLRAGGCTHWRCET